MAADKQIAAVGEVLSDEGNASLSAGEVADKVLEALESLRKRDFKYVVIAQDRSRPTSGGLREFCPTWVVGPFYTAAEAGAAARAERKAHPEVRVMTAQFVQPGEEIDPALLKEVLQ